MVTVAPLTPLFGVGFFFTTTFLAGLTTAFGLTFGFVVVFVAPATPFDAVVVVTAVVVVAAVVVVTAELSVGVVVCVVVGAVVVTGVEVVVDVEQLQPDVVVVVVVAPPQVHGETPPGGAGAMGTVITGGANGGAPHVPQPLALDDEPRAVATEIPATRRARHAAQTIDLFTLYLPGRV